jgi:hypothetical protein
MRFRLGWNLQLLEGFDHCSVAAIPLRVLGFDGFENGAKPVKKMAKR